MLFNSTGGREVAGSNPVTPTTETLDFTGSQGFFIILFAVYINNSPNSSPTTFYQLAVLQMNHCYYTPNIGILQDNLNNAVNSSKYSV